MGNYNNDRRPSGGRNFGRRDFSSRDGGRGFDRVEDRQMFKTVCSNCGKDCEVPFKPTNGKPVYCRDCFGKMRDQDTRSDYSPRPERSDFRAPSVDQNKNQFDALNIKLDKILRLLENKTPVATVVPIEAAKEPESIQANPEVKETKAPKAKKVAKKSTTKKEK